MKNIKYVNLMFSHYDIARLEEKDIKEIHADGFTIKISYHDFHTDVNFRCDCFDIVITRPKAIKQLSFKNDNANAYETIPKIIGVEIVYEDEKNNHIYLDFNNYNYHQTSNYNLKYEGYEELLITIRKEDYGDFFNPYIYY